MNEGILELLDNADLVRKGRVNIKKIRALSASQIRDFSLQSVMLTTAEEMQREKSLFSHSASVSLSGDRYPCMSLRCRLRRAIELAQFTAFYSERVYFRNFLGDYSVHENAKKFGSGDRLRQSFAEDIVIMLYLRPLVERGFLVPITPPHYCLHCLATQSFGPDADKRFKRIFNNLAIWYNKETAVSFMRTGSSHMIHFQGSDVLIDHGGCALLIPRYQRH